MSFRDYAKFDAGRYCMKSRYACEIVKLYWSVSEKLVVFRFWYFPRSVNVPIRLDEKINVEKF